MAEPVLANRIALITGAGRGIGRAVALAYARAGAHVILLARGVKALEDVDDEIRALGGTASLAPLDLADSEKIDNLGPTIYERWGRLDIFVANAGILGPLSPLGHISSDDWDEVLLINLTTNWRLIRTLDPLLRQSDAGRAIFLTSGAAQNVRAYWGPYAVSKAALEVLAKTYAAETVDTTMRVNLVNPGATATAMRAQAMPGEDQSTLPSPDDVAEIFVDLATPACDAHGTVVHAREQAAK
jgi:NAD(P)-dependent dehydrogenase (short-subunit alcohol dehydrogenase family)